MCIRDSSDAKYPRNHNNLGPQRPGQHLIFLSLGGSRGHNALSVVSCVGLAAFRLHFQRRGATERLNDTKWTIFLCGESNRRSQQHRQPQFFFFSGNDVNSEFADPHDWL